MTLVLKEFCFLNNVANKNTSALLAKCREQIMLSKPPKVRLHKGTGDQRPLASGSFLRKICKTSNPGFHNHRLWSCFKFFFSGTGLLPKSCLGPVLVCVYFSSSWWRRPIYCSERNCSGKNKMNDASVTWEAPWIPPYQFPALLSGFRTFQYCQTHKLFPMSTLHALIPFVHLV